MKTFAVFLMAGGMLGRLAVAQSQPQYTVTDLGTFGGGYSYAYAINNQGMIAGGAATPSQTGGLFQTAFLWLRGHLINLGTLGGPACPACSSEGSAASPSGEVVAISEIAAMDPNNEDFCGFGTHRQCLAAIWRLGNLAPLPLLPGGVNSQALWINSDGVAIGFSENGVFDTCGSPFQVRRFEAVKWSRQGQIQELAPLPGDTVAFAWGINEKGQAVGASGLCANTFNPPLGAPVGPHAVLWQKDGEAVNLGVLPGGTTYNATSINNQGQIVGNVQYADGSGRPFLWTSKDGMRDLGVPSGDLVAVIPCCGTINDRGDAAGFSCPGPMGSCRAVLWRNNAWTDLNTLLSPGAPLYLVNALSINEAGQIAGIGVTGTGEAHAFLASPAN